MKEAQGRTGVPCSYRGIVSLTDSCLKRFRIFHLLIKLDIFGAPIGPARAQLLLRTFAATSQEIRPAKTGVVSETDRRTQYAKWNSRTIFGVSLKQLVRCLLRCIA